jgi:hypothetical protein
MLSLLIIVSVVLLLILYYNIIEYFMRPMEGDEELDY